MQLTAESLLARVMGVSLAWCRRNYESSAKNRRCQATLAEYAKRLDQPDAEGNATRDIFCTTLAEDPESRGELDRCREVWGPVTEDPRLLDQRQRGLRRVYGEDAVRDAERVVADLSRAVFLLIKEPEKLEAEAQAVTPFVETAGEVERALEEAVGRAEAAILPAALVEERPAPVARPAPPPAPRAAIPPPPLKPRGRPPEMLREAARVAAARPVRSAAAQALLDSMKASTLASVNECLKKCAPLAAQADALTALLRETLG